MSNNLQGVLWAIVATALFTTVAAMGKIAVTEYHVLQILFIRQIIVFVSAVPSLVKTFPGSLKTKHPLNHSFRLAGAFVALSTGIWAVAVLPLTTAITLGFAQVFFVAILARFTLDEDVGIHRIAAVVVGFIGVVVVMRPGLDGFINIYALIPVAGALGAAVAQTSVRKLSQTESTATLLAYQSIFVGLLAGIPMFWFWQTPDLADFALLAGIGIVATFGQWIGIKALRLGEASIVANLQYSKLVFAALIGYLWFAEIPDSYTLLGAAIIIASSMYIFHREVLKRKKT
jgi:drug/metabolite transporter (DMT)-like permease